MAVGGLSGSTGDVACSLAVSLHSWLPVALVGIARPAMTLGKVGVRALERVRDAPHPKKGGLNGCFGVQTVAATSLLAPHPNFVESDLVVGAIGVANAVATVPGG